MKNEFPKNLLPEGWAAEPWSYTCDRYTVITRTAPLGSVTIDWQTRTWRGGMGYSGTPSSTKKYVGAGWRKRIAQDAIAWLEAA